jgi:hypothetical protein
MAQLDSQNRIAVAAGADIPTLPNAKNSPAAIFSWFAGSVRFDGCFPGILGLCLQQGVPNTCQLTFIAKEGEDGRNQQHQLPEDELGSPPMFKHGHRRQSADEKETDLANTEQGMTQ